MKYGYYNQYITGIQEDVPGALAELQKHVDSLLIDTLSNRPSFDEMVAKARQGDTIYVYSLTRSFSGLTDIAEVLTVLYAKGVDVVSLKDNFKADHTESGKVAFHTLILASTLINVDPSHGFYR